MRDAVTIVSEDSVLELEQWASGWLGAAWSAAGLGEREPEQMFHLEVVGRASTRPSPHGLAAVAALRRVAASGEWSMLDGTLEILSESQPVPQWSELPAFEPVRAWRAVDVWDSEHVLFVEFAGQTPHTLMAQISLAGGVLVDKLAVLQTGAAEIWDRLRESGEVPMPAVECPVEVALAELADALRSTDMTWPRHDGEDFVDLRALAWSRCRSYLPDFRDWQPMGDEERQRLLDGFAPAADMVVRSLADLFLDYGDGYMTSGPLCWSPGQVGLFLADWLPRKAALDVEQRAALPEVLRRWIRYVLERREIDLEWISPAVEAVDTFLPSFEEAFDDTAAWGPAKQIAAELTARGVDLSDSEAVEDAMRGLNAERLARYLTG
ncbi:hypothetical protein FHR83_002068 [Actinoplanes campanulatus]|uniref:Uncharacterized protein n=1 Tax=Actinoplanes campanulatus TaxID=113559 RepID=A0A7W5AE43_9ACTN|nr:hypothetical protein [Actinoplanes campanulatus]MBB3094416.1 hypothetical protein [Actinoplanes campanulatus]GGN20862.1 hypothetical protein GCM10010109_34790 [Actinoplanes campanulatus]GID35671.1 hypothetical protein Aca09nite_21770 [Actinoplanes campanulatus]